MSETNTDAFCWVKAVLRVPPSAPSPDETHPIDHPLLRALNLRAQGLVLADLSAPPAPTCALLADFESTLDFLGGKVPPPNANEIPKSPPPSGGGTTVTSVASTSALPIPGYWQQVSYAPGVDYAPGQPVVTLVFQPVAGPRDEAELWRNANPSWFRDAFAATLLNHGL